MSYKTATTARTRPFSKGPGSIHGWTTRRGYYRDSDPPGQILGARIVFWALLACVLFALANVAHSAPAVEPFVGWSHQSDIFTGRPFYSPPPGCEQAADWAGLGLTVSWPKTEVDFAHGVKVRDFWCGTPAREHGRSGTLLSVRWYPLRGRK